LNVRQAGPPSTATPPSTEIRDLNIVTATTAVRTVMADAWQGEHRESNPLASGRLTGVFRASC
jgi:hypothetical protein